MLQNRPSTYLLLALSLFVAACFGSSYSHPKYKRKTGGGVLAARRYIVELSQTSNVTIDSFIDYTNTHSDNVNIQRTISHKFLNAVSIGIKEDNVEKEHATLRLILDHMHVQSISPIQIFKQNQVVSVKKAQNNLSAQEVELVSPHRLSQVDRVHNELHLRGEDVFIGIIDTGVDYTHPALGGGFGPGFKIQAGYDLVGDNFNATDPSHTTQESNSPLDNCSISSGASGHGTHVSGIIGGYDPTNNFSGVAPGAKLGHWRVAGCSGDMSSDAILKAITMAYDAGVHIISMSLGSEQPWSAPESLESKLVKQISDSGVSVIVAAGNSGEEGVYTLGHPASVPSAFSVASVGNEYNYFDCSFSATGVSKRIACNLASNSTDDTKDEKPLIDGYIALPNDKNLHACSNLSANVKGKIVVASIDRSICANKLQMANIYNAGGIGAIFYDFSDSSYLAHVETSAYLSATVISFDNALAIMKALRSNPSMLIKFSNDLPVYLFKNEKFVSTASFFTSVGPTAELNFNPRIAAVGESVYSTVPVIRGSWEFMQGTSMACPYVSGAVALYLQQHGVNKTLPSVVHEKFQNYAFQTNVVNSTSRKLDNPLRIGAGAIQVYDAITQTTHITPAQISFNDTSTTDYKTATLTITNNGLEEVTYSIFNNVSVSITPYDRVISGYKLLDPAPNTEAPANIEISAVEISLGSGQSGTVTVTVHPPNTDPLDHVMYGGFIQFYPTNNNHAKALHVPYFGVVGNQRDIPIFEINDDFMVAVQAAEPINYKLNDTVILQHSAPWLLGIQYVKLTPTLILKGEVLSDNDVLGQFTLPERYLQRTYSGEVDKLFWDGSYFKDLPYNNLSSTDPITSVYADIMTVVGGTYHLRVSALKLFGDINNIADWDYFTAGPFVVQ